MSPYDLGQLHGKTKTKICHEYPFTYTKAQREEYIKGFESV